MQILKILSIILFLTYSLYLQAEEKIVCVITSDIDSNTAKIMVDIDQDSHKILHLYQDSFANSKLIERIEIKEEHLKEGVILDREGRFITVRIHSDSFDFSQGGKLYIDTLYNGITGRRIEYEMDMNVDENGPVLEKNNQTFTKMFFTANTSIFFGVIGIEDITFSN